MIIRKVILTILTIFILTSISLAIEPTPVAGKIYTGYIDDVKCYLDFDLSTFGPNNSGRVLISCDDHNIAYYYRYEQPENERMIKLDNLGFLYQTSKDILLYMPTMSEYVFTTKPITTQEK